MEDTRTTGSITHNALNGPNIDSPITKGLGSTVGTLNGRSHLVLARRVRMTSERRITYIFHGTEGCLEV